MQLKRYKVAPLPFQGQKRNFVEPFVGKLKELSQSQDIKVVVDLYILALACFLTPQNGFYQDVKLFTTITTAFRLVCEALSARMSC